MNKRLCVVCGKDLNKSASKFCSKSCEKEFPYNEFVAEWLKGDKDGTIGVLKPKPSKFVYRFFKDQPQVCNICGCDNIWMGMPLVLEIDHKDGNRANNSFENLRLVCPNCHSQTHTFRNKPRHDR